MTESVTCCSPDARLPEVARAMIECDCGEIPVVDDPGAGELRGPTVAGGQPANARAGPSA